MVKNSREGLKCNVINYLNNQKIFWFRVFQKREEKGEQQKTEAKIQTK